MNECPRQKDNQEWERRYLDMSLAFTTAGLPTSPDDIRDAIRRIVEPPLTTQEIVSIAAKLEEICDDMNNDNKEPTQAEIDQRVRDLKADILRCYAEREDQQMTQSPHRFINGFPVLELGDNQSTFHETPDVRESHASNFEQIRQFIADNREIAQTQMERWDGVDPSRMLQALDYLELFVNTQPDPPTHPRCHVSDVNYSIAVASNADLDAIREAVKRFTGVKMVERKRR